MVKPGELIDLEEVTPLTRTDKVIYNQLIANAWDNILDDCVHRIKKSELRRNHKANDRIDECMTRLMGAVAVIHGEKDGRRARLKVQLLGANVDVEGDESYFYYSFPPQLRSIIKHSTVFAKLHTQLLFVFRSKYGLSLYEMYQKRRNLKYKNWEPFTVDELRAFLGVEKGKLPRFADLNKHAIKPAVEEVNEFSDHYVTIEAVKKEGKKVVALHMVWTEKSEDQKLIAQNNAWQATIELEKREAKSREKRRVQAVKRRQTLAVQQEMNL